MWQDKHARKINPAGYYHVMPKGNNCEDIFSGDWQKAYFTELLLKKEKRKWALTASLPLLSG